MWHNQVEVHVFPVRPRLRRGYLRKASVTLLQLIRKNCNYFLYRLNTIKIPMTGDRYFISDPLGTHFLTLTIVDWVDLFSRPIYKSIITDSLTYCSQLKVLVIYGWVVMSNHLHLLARTEPPHTLSIFLRDLQKFTSRQITASIETQPESRRKWLLDRFSFEAKRSRRAEIYKVWRDGNYAVLY